jgi:uncharacterized peroxidase-related enzyme
LRGHSGRTFQERSMSRITTIDRNTTNPDVRRTFDGIQQLLGVVPNMMRTMAQSPRVLDGYLGLNGALTRGLLPATLREQIAIAVAEANDCDYCLSAHTFLGRVAGLSDRQLEASREGRAEDGRSDAALQFARAVIERRGGISDADLARVRAAGLSDGEIVEIVAHVGLNVFTNYFNRVAQTDVDFPKITARRARQLA